MADFDKRFSLPLSTTPIISEEERKIIDAYKAELDGGLSDYRQMRGMNGDRPIRKIPTGGPKTLFDVPDEELVWPDEASPPSASSTRRED